MTEVGIEPASVRPGFLLRRSRPIGRVLELYSRLGPSRNVTLRRSRSS